MPPTTATSVHHLRSMPPPYLHSAISSTYLTIWSATYNRVRRGRDSWTTRATSCGPPSCAPPASPRASSTRGAHPRDAAVLATLQAVGPLSQQQLAKAPRRQPDGDGQADRRPRGARPRRARAQPGRPPGLPAASRPARASRRWPRCCRGWRAPRRELDRACCTAAEHERLNALLRALIEPPPPALADRTGFLLTRASHRFHEHVDAVLAPLGIRSALRHARAARRRRCRPSASSPTACSVCDPGRGRARRRARGARPRRAPARRRRPAPERAARHPRGHARCSNGPRTSADGRARGACAADRRGGRPRAAVAAAKAATALGARRWRRPRRGPAAG